MIETSSVFFTPSDDPELRAATQAAQQTFRYFWRELAWEGRRIVPALDLACVKVPFADESGRQEPTVEHMWVDQIGFDGQLIRGVLLNRPNWLRSVAQGDAVAVALEQIEDWMYAIAGRVYGAFTVNLIRRRMSAPERADHDAAWGLDFGDPHRIELVPGQYLDHDGSRTVGRDPAVVDPGEAEHPMAVNMREPLQQGLRANPSMVHHADDRGFTLLHDQALAGDANGVEVLLQHGARADVAAHNGLTPRDLAQALRWTKVVELLRRS